MKQTLRSKLFRHATNFIKNIKFEISPNIDDCVFHFAHIRQGQNNNKFWDTIEKDFQDAVETGQIMSYRKNQCAPKFTHDISGYTVCYMKSPTGKVLAVGYSFCGANDQFNKKIGRNIAKERAIEVYSRNKNEAQKTC